MCKRYDFLEFTGFVEPRALSRISTIISASKQARVKVIAQKQFLCDLSEEVIPRYRMISEMRNKFFESADQLNKVHTLPASKQNPECAGSCMLPNGPSEV